MIMNNPNQKYYEKNSNLNHLKNPSPALKKKLKVLRNYKIESSPIKSKTQSQDLSFIKKNIKTKLNKLIEMKNDLKESENLSCKINELDDLINKWNQKIKLIIYDLKEKANMLGQELNITDILKGLNLDTNLFEYEN